MTESKKYYKNVKKLFPIHGKKERIFLNNIKEQIKEYKYENPQATYDDYSHVIGTPIDIVVSYYQESNSTYLLKRINIKRNVSVFISIIMVLAITLWGFEMYRLNQLYEEAKASINGYYEESIEYEYIEEN